jgi:ribosomal protein L24
MKIRVTKGKWKGTQGKVVGVYMDGCYDIKVSHRKPNEPKYRAIKINDCQEIGE